MRFNKFKKDEKAIMFNILIVAGLAIVVFFALINIGTFINSNLQENIYGTLDEGMAHDGASYWFNNTFHHRINRTMKNLSGDYDDVLDSLTIAAIVMAITLPLAAIVAIRKFF